ncbi:cytochrome C [bacterium]|nr:cytochrome C [bacterium]
MKDFINVVSDPIYSFWLVLIGFWAMLRYYKFVGSKKFLLFSSIGGVTIFLWMFQDPNFKAIVTWPDNVPISILIVALFFFTWLTLHKMAINDTRIENGEGPIEGTPENREKVWTWPNLVYTELFAIIAGTVFLCVWAIIFKAPLEEPANPTWAPNPAKAPWYFLGLQEMLVYFDPWMAGVILPGLIVAGLIAIPYIDTNPKGNGYYTFKERKLAVSLYFFGWLVLWNYLIIIGTFLRGPNWTFYGPFEYWDFHKVVAEININLSEIVWIKTLGVGLPDNMFLREIFGIILTLLYVGVIPFVLERINFKNRFLSKLNLIGEISRGIKENSGSIRYYIYVFLLIATASLPIKMILRWVFSLKYIVALPELELNL